MSHSWLDRWTPELFMIVVLALAAFGTLMTYSSSVFYAEEVFHSRYYFLNRQLTWLALGAAAAAVMRVVHYQWLQRVSWLLLALATGALLLVYVPGLGRSVNNAARWIRVGPVSIQPSEFAKYAVILFVAERLSANRRYIEQLFRGVALPLGIAAVPLLLIAAEPDLGTPVVVGLTVVTLCYVAGTRISNIAAVALAALPAVGLLIWMYPYRMRRLVSFVNPDSDPRGAGFQAAQSLIAIGSGHLKGIGLGKSVQKMFYLPEAHTDFVFSIIGEELGLIGAGALIGAFILLVWLMYRMTRQVTDMFGHLVAVGIMTLLGLQTVINIGVVTSSLPTKGIALPFISYGGSTLVATLGACGLLLNIVQNQHNLRSGQPRIRLSEHTVI